MWIINMLIILDRQEVHIVANQYSKTKKKKKET